MYYKNNTVNLTNSPRRGTLLFFRCGLNGRYTALFRSPGGSPGEECVNITMEPGKHLFVTFDIGCTQITITGDSTEGIRCIKEFNFGILSRFII